MWNLKLKTPLLKNIWGSQPCNFKDYKVGKDFFRGDTKNTENKRKGNKFIFVKILKHLSET
jgi:hypothetical protein